jgi:hypothetical protein
MDDVDLFYFIYLFFSIIIPLGKSQLGHVDQFKTIKYYWKFKFHKKYELFII